MNQSEICKQMKEALEYVAMDISVDGTLCDITMYKVTKVLYEAARVPAEYFGKADPDYPKTAAKL
jgi:hypothetical protein